MSIASHPLQAFLAGIPLFATLAPDDLPDVLRALRPFSMGEGEVLFRQGDAGDAAYVVESGAVEIRVGARTVARMGPGEVFGELALIDGAPRSATAVCLERGGLHRLDKQELDFLRRNRRPAAYKILRVLALTLSERLRETNEQIARALVPAEASGADATSADATNAADASTGAKGLLARLAFWKKS